MTDLEKLRGMSPEDRGQMLRGYCAEPHRMDKIVSALQRADTTVTCPTCGGDGREGENMEGHRGGACDDCNGTGSISIRKDTALKIAEWLREQGIPQDMDTNDLNEWATEIESREWEE